MPVTPSGGVPHSTCSPIKDLPLLRLMRLATTNLENKFGVFTYLSSDIHHCH